METFLPVRLDQVAKYGCQQFQCPQCEGERYLACRRRPASKDIWERLGFRKCAVCLGIGTVGFEVWALLRADDDYATRLLRRVNRALSSRDAMAVCIGVKCAEILRKMRDIAQCHRHKFKDFCSGTEDWTRLEKRVARAKAHIDAAKDNYFNQLTQKRLDRQSLLRELQNEAAERSRQAREATRELEDKYLRN